MKHLFSIFGLAAGLSLTSLANASVTYTFATSNQQVAATIVQALGYDPRELQAVLKEQVQVLPFLFNRDPLFD